MVMTKSIKRINLAGLCWRREPTIWPK